MAYAITQKVEQVERKRRTREREPEKDAKKKEKRKACNTGRSRVVSHHSTLPAQRSLTAESGRDPVFSPWYDRRQHPLPRSALCTARQPGFHHPQKAGRANRLAHPWLAARRNPPWSLLHHGPHDKDKHTANDKSNWPQNEKGHFIHIQCTVSTGPIDHGSRCQHVVACGGTRELFVIRPSICDLPS